MIYIIKKKNLKKKLFEKNEKMFKYDMNYICKWDEKKNINLI